MKRLLSAAVLCFLSVGMPCKVIAAAGSSKVIAAAGVVIGSGWKDIVRDSVEELLSGLKPGAVIFVARTSTTAKEGAYYPFFESILAVIATSTFEAGFKILSKQPLETGYYIETDFEVKDMGVLMTPRVQVAKNGKVVAAKTIDLPATALPKSWSDRSLQNVAHELGMKLARSRFLAFRKNVPVVFRGIGADGDDIGTEFSNIMRGYIEEELSEHRHIKLVDEESTKKTHFLDGIYRLTDSEVVLNLTLRKIRPEAHAIVNVASSFSRAIILPETGNCVGCNLISANLKGADLTKANLAGADLSKANLAGADLTEANLTDTDLTDADLTGVDLTGADLSRAVLIRAELNFADLTDAFLTDAILANAILSEANLTGTDLTGAILTGADVTGTILEEEPTQLVKKKAEDEAVKLAQAELKSKQEATTAVDKSLELEFWKTVNEMDDADMFQAYIDQFPKGVYVTIAKLKIKKLGSGTSTVAKVSKPSIPKLDYGDYYALVIGNNRYEHLQNLRTAVNDARNVADLLKADYGFDVTLLEDANRSQIVKSISELRGKVSSQDNVLIYYAGHGYLDEAADEGFWLPVDASPDEPSNWIMTDRIVSQIRAMEAKHVMIVADSCFSGTLTRGLKIEQRTPEWLKRIVKKKARTALTSGGLEPVSDSGGGENSVFAHAFLSILKDNDGLLDASKLFKRLKPKVKLNSKQTPEYGDIREAGHDGGDFLFVRQK